MLLDTPTLFVGSLSITLVANSERLKGKMIFFNQLNASVTLTWKRVN